MDKIDTKFWLINDFEKFLINGGINQSLTDLITFISALIILFIVLILLDIIGNRIILKFIHHAAERTKSKWDDFLVKNHFFRRSLRFLVSIVMILIIERILEGYNESVVHGALIVTECLSIYFVMSVAISFIDTVNDIYMTMKRSKERSIKGYIQTIKIIIIVIAIILGISIIFNVDISKIFLSLATSAAILTFVFKDTLLGFVASIQLSAQDMVRLGDWVVMESKGANGTVIDMNVNTVKVLNWDNTITMLPIYMMVSDAFINWRSMEEGDGRRLTIPLRIDVNSVRTVSREEMQDLETSVFFSEYYDDMMRLKNVNSADGTTNISLFRAYAESYLRANSSINEDMTLLVRYLPMDDSGMILQLYAFSREKTWAKYEAVVPQVTEQMLAAAMELGVKIYQRSSNTSLPK